MQADDEETVKRNWEQLKLKEKGSTGVLERGAYIAARALVKAMRIQEKARGAGFDWEEPAQVWEKVQEELARVWNRIRGRRPYRGP